ncbi:hypothetical protein [Rhizobium leguminosarum]|uniref:hypothetical protein n=1 Tax=Rhizobium leguminosarum TaxID=384 RepID=UPI002E0F8327|nr:hypothetical protein U8Q02_42565 [Rhizobium leguminosarum]
MDLERIGMAWDEAVEKTACLAGVERWQLEEAFAYGCCDVLAVELHERLGLPLGQATEGEGFCHAFAWIGDEHCLDALGVRGRDVVAAVWNEDDQGCVLLDVEAAELREWRSAHPRPFEQEYAPILAEAFAWASRGLLPDHQHSIST